MTRNKILSILLGLSLLVIFWQGLRLAQVRSALAEARQGSSSEVIDAISDDQPRVIKPDVDQDRRFAELQQDNEPDEIVKYEEQFPEAMDVGFSAEDERELVKTLLVETGDKRWERLGELGVEIKNEDFKKALSELTGTKKHSNQTKALGIIREWVEYDPVAASEWVKELPEGSLYTRAVMQVVRIWAQNDPDAVGNWLSSLDKGKDSAIRQYIYRIARSAPKMAVEWYSRIEDEKTRLSAASVITGGLAANNLEDAIDFVEKLPEGSYRDRSVNRLVYSIAKEDALIALEWASTIDNERMRENSVAHAVGQWSRKEPTRAGVYINELPAGSLRDNCVRQYTMSMVDSVPATAVEWAQSIEDSKLQERTLRMVFYRWGRKDPETSREWVARSNLDDSTKENILRVISRYADRDESGRRGRREYDTLN